MSTSIHLGGETKRNEQKRLKRSSRKVEEGTRWKSHECGIMEAKWGQSSKEDRVINYWDVKYNEDQETTLDYQ